VVVQAIVKVALPDSHGADGVTLKLSNDGPPDAAVVGGVGACVVVVVLGAAVVGAGVAGGAVEGGAVTGGAVVGGAVVGAAVVAGVVVVADESSLPHAAARKPRQTTAPTARVRRRGDGAVGTALVERKRFGMWAIVRSSACCVPRARP
jgi:hypothetical protein